MTKIQSNPLRDMRGDPHINLCIAVLREARRGNTEMWQCFQKEYDIFKVYHNPFEIALWVAGWWERDLVDKGKPRRCPECNVTTYCDLEKCDVCDTKLV